MLEVLSEIRTGIFFTNCFGDFHRFFFSGIQLVIPRNSYKNPKKKRNSSKIFPGISSEIITEFLLNILLVVPSEYHPGILKGIFTKSSIRFQQILRFHWNFRRFIPAEILSEIRALLLSLIPARIPPEIFFRGLPGLFSKISSKNTSKNFCTDSSKNTFRHFSKKKLSRSFYRNFFKKFSLDPFRNIYRSLSRCFSRNPYILSEIRLWIPQGIHRDNSPGILLKGFF